jgi:hypothetical protein
MNKHRRLLDFTQKTSKIHISDVTEKDSFIVIKNKKILGFVYFIDSQKKWCFCNNTSFSMYENLFGIKDDEDFNNCEFYEI